MCCWYVLYVFQKKGNRLPQWPLFIIVCFINISQNVTKQYNSGFLFFKGELLLQQTSQSTRYTTASRDPAIHFFIVIFELYLVKNKTNNKKNSNSSMRFQSEYILFSREISVNPLMYSRKSWNPVQSLFQQRQTCEINLLSGHLTHAFCYCPHMSDSYF